MTDARDKTSFTPLCPVLQALIPKHWVVSVHLEMAEEQVFNLAGSMGLALYFLTLSTWKEGWNQQRVGCSACGVIGA